MVQGILEESHRAAVKIHHFVYVCGCVIAWVGGRHQEGCLLVGVKWWFWSSLMIKMKEMAPEMAMKITSIAHWAKRCVFNRDQRGGHSAEAKPEGPKEADAQRSRFTRCVCSSEWEETKRAWETITMSHTFHSKRENLKYTCNRMIMIIHIKCHLSWCSVCDSESCLSAALSTARLFREILSGLWQFRFLLTPWIHQRPCWEAVRTRCAPLTSVGEEFLSTLSAV